MDEWEKFEMALSAIAYFEVHRFTPEEVVETMRKIALDALLPKDGKESES